MNIYSNFQDILTFLNTEQKERCDMLVEVHTSHSWWERCCKEKNHKGYCDSALTKKEMINAAGYFQSFELL